MNSRDDPNYLYYGAIHDDELHKFANVKDRSLNRRCAFYAECDKYVRRFTRFPPSSLLELLWAKSGVVFAEDPRRWD